MLAYWKLIDERQREGERERKREKEGERGILIGISSKNESTMLTLGKLWAVIHDSDLEMTY